MKFLLLFFFTLTALCSTAQDSSLLKPRFLRISITPARDTVISGWLTDITDSSVMLNSMQARFRLGALALANQQQVRYNQIERFTLKRKNGGARGFGIGLLSGFAVGGIIGLASGDDKSGFVQFSAGEKALAAGAGLGLVGGIVGAIIGAVARKTFIIKGKSENFQAARLSILDKAYRNTAPNNHP